MLDAVGLEPDLSVVVDVMYPLELKSDVAPGARNAEAQNIPGKTVAVARDQGARIAKRRAGARKN
jgi:hypothetical protein